MRNMFVLALIVVGAATAEAEPGDRRSSDATVDDVHVTVTAGRGRLGFAALQISPELRKHLGAPEDRGVLVDQIRSGSPAERAGLRVGDVLIDVDAEATRSASDILAAIADRKRGATVPLVVVRGAQRLTLQATLADNPGPRLDRLGELGRRWLDAPGDPPELRSRLEQLERRLDQLERAPR
jgi:S1-C subfamily serine protease